ncbi:hypothetical protein VTK26DRAFT_8906 [Humicola hyalothermophila]
MVDKLTPGDPRVQHRTFTIPGSSPPRTYHYLLASPSSSSSGPAGPRPVATALLVHGFPDLAFGWRYQVPFLLARGLRVIVPDMVGYGRTDAPRELGAYSYRSVVEDLRELVRRVLGEAGEGEGERIVLGGHDWGGAIAWRFALWYPEMLRCVFSVCTPYFAPSAAFVPREVLVEKLLPNFGYQLQLAGPDVEAAVVGRDRIRAFLSIMYAARASDGTGGLFSPAKGVRLDKVAEPGAVGESPLLSKEEMDFYVGEFERNGIRGPLNWYRTHEINFAEEGPLVEQGRNRVTMPALMIVASGDVALPPAMAAGMDKYCDNLVKREVKAGHWALWEAPVETNRHIGEFLDAILKNKPAAKASI